MWKNYLLTAWRNLGRNRVYAAINIGGLAVGITCCLLIFLYVRVSLSYDSHHAKADRVYRGVWHRVSDAEKRMAFVPSPVTAAVREFPEVEESARMMHWPHTLVENGERRFYEERVYLADSSLLKILSIPLKSGNARSALDAPDAVILSETAAEKLFGNENPMGKMVTLGKTEHLRVTGVMAKTSAPSHLQADYIGSFGLARKSYGKRLDSWGWNQFHTYLLLRKGADGKAFEKKFNSYLANKEQAGEGEDRIDFKICWQPLKEVYLHSAGIEHDHSERGNYTYVVAFTVVALFILAIACLNFMNLTTAQSLRRAKEVGIRKVAGAHRRQLVAQFLAESVLLTLIAFFIALLITELSIGYFSQLAGEQLALNYPTDLLLVLVLMVASVPVGLLAGVYPAFFLSAFLPVEVLKGHSGAKGYRLSTLRKSLVVTQFAISIALIASTLVVYQQLRFLSTKDLGFDEAQTLVLQMEGDEMQRGVERFKSALLQNPKVLSTAASYGVPGGHLVGDAVYVNEQKNATPVNMLVVDFDYLTTLKMQVIAGRSFSKSFPTDLEQGFVINETAVKELGFGTPEQAIGQKMACNKWTETPQLKNGRVVGVVRDFHYRSMHQKIEPTVLHLSPEHVWWVTVKLHPEQLTETLGFLEKKWKEFAPGYPFEYVFMDEAFDKMYASERKMSKVFTLFSLLAIAIACMGLLGLVAFAAEQRTKEIGIRKTLGASILQILMLLSGDFARLVLVAMLIATPLTWYGMHQWLQDYAYRININWWIFGVAGIAALTIAMLTVSLQTLKIASINPIKALRTE